MPRPEDAGGAAVDALFADALHAGERRVLARGLLAVPIEEPVLVAVLRRAVPAAFLEELAATRPWSERGRVLAAVVLSPRAPRALCLRLAGLVDAVGRAAQHHSRPQELPGGARGQIVLAEMDPVGADGHRQIHPIVHDERDPGPVAAVAQSLGER